MFHVANSTQESSAAGLDGLDLGQIDRCPVEAGRKLGAIEEDALGGSNGTKLRARSAANARVWREADGLLERTVLLGVVAVGAEGGVAGGRGGCAEAFGELARGRGRVRLGRVVDGSCARLVRFSIVNIHARVRST
jgi:hypothetical protein